MEGEKTTARWYCCATEEKTDDDDAFLCVRMYNVGKTPMLITCPSCRSTETTDVAYISTKETFVAALFLLPLLLCWLPYCTVTFRKARHHCGTCGAYIGESH